MIAEIQQSSDTTYRLFDWNRIGPDGKPRQLHIQQALDVIDFRQGPVDPIRPTPTGSPEVNRLVACDKFALDRWELSAPRQLGEHGRCHILLVVAGAVDVSGDPSGRPLKLGETLLLPASVGPIELAPVAQRAVLLDIYLP